MPEHELFALLLIKEWRVGNHETIVLLQEQLSRSFTILLYTCYFIFRSRSCRVQLTPLVRSFVHCAVKS